VKRSLRERGEHLRIGASVPVRLCSSSRGTPDLLPKGLELISATFVAR